MDAAARRQMNQTAFRRLESSIRQTYPHGQWVAIAGGQIVADAASYQELSSRLRALGHDPRETMFVRAGFDYPERLTILTQISA